ERDGGRADVGALFQINLGAGAAGVGEGVIVVVGGGGVDVGDDLLVLELAKEVRKGAEGQAQLLGNPASRGGPDRQEELQDQALHHRRVQARRTEVRDGSGAERGLGVEMNR